MLVALVLVVVLVLVVGDSTGVVAADLKKNCNNT